MYPPGTVIMAPSAPRQYNRCLITSILAQRQSLRASNLGCACDDLTAKRKMAQRAAFFPSKKAARCAEITVTAILLTTGTNNQYKFQISIFSRLPRKRSFSTADNDGEKERRFFSEKLTDGLLTTGRRQLSAVRCKAPFAWELAAGSDARFVAGGSEARVRSAARSRAHVALILRRARRKKSRAGALGIHRQAH